MPVIAGFDKLETVPQEQITDKIRRRVVSGKQGTMVYWSIEAGARAAAHKHPHEQFVWMVRGTMDFRIGDEKRTMKPGDVAVIPGGVEHEAYFPEDSEVIDFFAPFEPGQHVFGRVCGQRVSFGGDRGGAQFARIAQPDSSWREPQSSAIPGPGEREPPKEPSSSAHRARVRCSTELAGWPDRKDDRHCAGESQNRPAVPCLQHPPAGDAGTDGCHSQRIMSENHGRDAPTINSTKKLSLFEVP